MRVTSHFSGISAEDCYKYSYEVSTRHFIADYKEEEIINLIDFFFFFDVCTLITPRLLWSDLRNSFCVRCGLITIWFQSFIQFGSVDLEDVIFTILCVRPFLVLFRLSFIEIYIFNFHFFFEDCMHWTLLHLGFYFKKL